MSSVIVPFLYELRARKLRVGTQEAVALARALAAGLHESSLEGFYHVARALCVHREGDLDAFDQAFSAHFRGIDAASVRLLDEISEWLADPRLRRELSEEERAALEALDWDELRRQFEERLRTQKGRHDGGSHWIGTGGTSPFGAHGVHPSGIRVGPHGGGRSAIAVADARRFKPYRSDLVLDVRQMEVALRKLRAFSREGGARELDLDATIAETAKNGGELEIVERPPRRPNVRVILLMDVGGSMDPYAELVSQLFSAAKRASNLRELRTYYFHNCIYGHVFETERFTEPLRVVDLLRQCGPEYKLVLVGDAAMHPAELFGHGGWSWTYGAESSADGGLGRSAPGIRWMQSLADHFWRSAWLNPEPPSYWHGGTAQMLSQIFPMFPLTLDGLGDAITHLSKGAAVKGDPSPSF